MDPDVKNLMNYKGRQPMTNHPWTTIAYDESRFSVHHAPMMIYMPSVDILQKMILACSKSVSGLLIQNEFDILERFISIEKIKEKELVGYARFKKDKVRDKRLENYANENAVFKKISEFESVFGDGDHEDQEIDTQKLAEFIPAHKTSKV